MIRLKRPQIIEAVGVPENIINSAKKLYDILFDIYNSIGDIKPFIGNKKTALSIKDFKINVINYSFNFIINDDIDKPVVLISMGVASELAKHFYVDKLLRIKDNKLILNITLGIKSNVNKKNVIDFFKEEKIELTSKLTHELKHKFDNIKYSELKIKNLSRYETATGPLFFNVKAMDEFFHNMYYTEPNESLVRPSEIATRMDLKNITKEKFYDFIINDETYKDLTKIKNITYENFVAELKKEINKIDEFFAANSIENENLTIDQKVDEFMRIAYISFSHHFFNLVQNKVLTPIDLFLGIAKDKESFLNKIFATVVKYKDKEKEFFKKEILKMNKEAKNVLKRISKIYSLINDDKKNSIHEWELHKKSQKKAKIYTDYIRKL